METSLENVCSSGGERTEQALRGLGGICFGQLGLALWLSLHNLATAHSLVCGVCGASAD